MDDTVQYAEVTFLKREFQTGVNRNIITITPYQPTTYSDDAAGGQQGSSNARNFNTGSSSPLAWPKRSCWSLPLQVLHYLFVCVHVPQTICVALLVHSALTQCPCEDYWIQCVLEVIVGIWLLTDVIMTVKAVRAEIQKIFGQLTDWAVHLLILFVSVGVLNVWVFPYCKPASMTIPEQVHLILWWTYGLSFVVALVRIKVEKKAEGQRALRAEWHDVRL